MPQTFESQFLDFIKSGEDVYQDPPGATEPNSDAISFSDVAQDSNKEVKEDVPNRLLSQKSRSDAAERALVGAVLNTKDLETSSIQLKPVEKVSFQRSPTLLEDTVRKLGRK